MIRNEVAKTWGWGAAASICVSHSHLQVYIIVTLSTAGMASMSVFIIYCTDSLILVNEYAARDPIIKRKFML